MGHHLMTSFLRVSMDRIMSRWRWCIGLWQNKCLSDLNTLYRIGYSLVYSGQTNIYLK